MKKLINLALVFVMLFCFTACSQQSETESITKSASEKMSETQSNTENHSIMEGKTLVIYFSATGTTQAAAEEIIKLTGADVFEIEPSTPYTSEDLNYNDNNSRANIEMNDNNSRPEIRSSIDNFSDYDIVFIGYPIWWGTCPKIINTLMDTYDFSGKTIIPFCTSGSSTIDKSVEEIKANEPNANIYDGMRISESTDIQEWLDSLDI